MRRGSPFVFARSWVTCSYQSTSLSLIASGLGGVRPFEGPWSSARCARVAFLPTPEAVEVAGLLLRKAASDLSAARALARDPDQQDDVVGFHAQQAVEKSLKAVLAVRGFEIPRTHDLDLLTRLVALDPYDFADALAGAKDLSPWAVATRYDDIDATLNRGAAVEIAEKSLIWARERVDAARGDEDGG
jgi:HEPN domain-containing protein